MKETLLCTANNKLGTMKAGCMKIIRNCHILCAGISTSEHYPFRDNLEIQE